MRAKMRLFSIMFSGFILGLFYTNCSPNQFSLKEQALLAELQQPQQQQQEQEQEQEQEQTPPSTTDSTEPSVVEPDLVFEQKDNWQNYFSVWIDTAKNRVRYAKQMGYDYIGVSGYWDRYNTKTALEELNKDELSKGKQQSKLKFYIIGPEYNGELFSSSPALPEQSIIAQQIWSDGGRNISPSYAFTSAQKDWYNKRAAWKSKDTWPNNLGTGWFYSVPQQIFSIVWDFQQQAVIDEVVAKTIVAFKSADSQNSNFKFAGFMIDVPTLNGDFHKSTQAGTTISNWTGNGSTVLHDGITHEYATYQDGSAAFYRKLRSSMTSAFPEAKWIVDPAVIYSLPAWGYDEWVYTIKDRADKIELTPDLLMEEHFSTDFVDRKENFNSGLNITKNMVGSHQRSKVEEETNRLIAAKAGINGAWFNWFGRFSNAYKPSIGWTMPNFTSITNVYPRLKLIRVIPNWDNLNKVPLSERSWDGSVYQSTKSYISSDVMYSRQPKTGKLFAVFNTTNGKIKLRPSEKVESIKDVNDFFEERNDVQNLFKIESKTDGYEINFTDPASVTIDVDSGPAKDNGEGNGQIKGNGYIITISFN